MSEGDEGPEGVEDDARVDDAVVVELAEVLDRRDALLVVLEAVDLAAKRVSFRGLIKTERTYLHSDADVFQNLVDDADVEVRMVATEFVEQDGKKVNVAVLDLPDLRERTVELPHDLFHR